MAQNNIDVPVTDNNENIDLLIKKQSDNILTPPREWVKLNVGGTIFCTSQKTIQKYPNCFLHKLFLESQDKLSPYIDETGALLIDRDPKYFSMLLNYMRSGRVFLCEDFCENALIAEAEFFNISGLLEIVKQKIKDRKFELQANSVHRMCSLKYDELASFLSSLSDGWKLCQILPSPSGSSYMVIVSKSFDTSLSLSNQPLAAKAVKVFDEKPKEPPKHKTKSLKFL
ncbi:BTB/POZ domain-containing protein isoform X2 [Oopsacas minuta]|uniref:BTB/POZ domain-containing protein isoform X2 n=1 Tax=Oopsacas minuta TaxID=111878 RepID=A0AAV7JZ32_9METZ|nr:BTB/POZ domain-containing protein isoform X2 [Oopsacas minuta]